MFARLTESSERRESTRETSSGRPMSESCPIRIEMDHLPEIDRTRKMSMQRRRSTRFQSSAGITLPMLHGQDVFGLRDYHFFSSGEDLRRSVSGPLHTKKREYKGKFNYVGPSACVTDFDLLPGDELNVTTKRKEEKLEESHALKRWEYWMKEKHQMQEYLGRRLQRSPCRLLLQESDKYRRWLEERWLSTCTQIPEADKWRGHPFRWKAEVRLPNRKIRWNQPKSGSPPDYCAVKTSLDKGEIPAMEFIGIPQTIKKEKGLICPDESVENSREFDFLGAEEVQYLLRRRKKLKPHEISMDELEVIGQKIGEDKEVSEESSIDKDIPEIIIEANNEPCASQTPEPPPSIFCLIIGDKQVKYEFKTDYCQAPCKIYCWQVNFGSNPVGNLIKRSLRVENRGTVAIRYHWTSLAPQTSLNLEKLQPRQYEPWFFFNKNSGFFLPGQIYKLKFYHKATYSGVRKEVWFLKTEPPMSSRNNACTIIFSAIATEEIPAGIHPLEKYLEDRVRDTIVTCIIEIIIKKVFLPYKVGGIEYRSLFSSRVLFEHNNPNLYYNSTIVKQLYEIFLQNDQCRTEWDFSLDTLIRMVKNGKIGQDKNALLIQISEKAKLLLKPTYFSSRDNKKYRMVYQILCRMMNFMESDYRYCRSSVSRKVEGMPSRRNETENEEQSSSHYSSREDLGEAENFVLDLWEINPINFLFFKNELYLRVYRRLCEAVEHAAGVIETEKLFEPWKQVSYKLQKPFRKSP